MVMIELLLFLFLLLPTFEKHRFGMIRVTTLFLLILSRIIVVVAVIIAIADVDVEDSYFLSFAAASTADALHPSHCQMSIAAR
jgi:hypothetical protein